MHPKVKKKNRYTRSLISFSRTIFSSIRIEGHACELVEVTKSLNNI